MMSFEMDMSRRDAFKYTAAGVLLGLGLTNSEGPGLDTQEDTHHTMTTAQYQEPFNDTTLYLPAWGLEDKEYDAIEGPAFESAGSVLLSFAEFQPNGKLKLPTMTPGLERLLDGDGQQQVGLAVGGYGNDDQHQKLVKGWNFVVKNPQAATERLLAAVDHFGAKILDIDFEYPLELVTDDFPIEAVMDSLTRFMHGLRKDLSQNIALSIAYPVGYYSKGFDLAALAPALTTVRAMAYDLAGPWDDKAGNLAGGREVEAIVDGISKKLGDDNKLQVGFPAYGYRFKGSKYLGDNYDNKQEFDTEKDEPTIQYQDIPTRTMRDDHKERTSSAIAEDGSWITFQSPAMIKATCQAIRQKHPDIGGVFFWDARGVTEQHMQAVA